MTWSDALGTRQILILSIGVAMIVIGGLGLSGVY